MSNYFTSKSIEYTFYLIELDGKARADKLGIELKHYSRKKEAEKWHNNILDILNSGEKHENLNKAVEKLHQLYNDMIR